MKLERKTDEEVQNIVSQAVDDALSFIESEIDPDRDKAQRYYNGEVDVAQEPGRSGVIATKCGDVVRQVKPSLMRVFFSSDKPGEFIPRTPNDVLAAEQATQMASYLLERNNGYTLLNGAFQDALVKKGGIIKAFYDEAEDVEYDEISGQTDDEFAMVVRDDNVTVLEHEAYAKEIMLPDGSVAEITCHDAKISRRDKRGEIKVMSVAPEDFFIDNQASCMDDFYVIGHKSDMRVGDLVAMGFDFEEVVDLGEDRENDDEAQHARTGFQDDGTDENYLDPTMKPVTVYEAYMRMDVEGEGVPILHYFLLAGAKKELLDFGPADMVPFAFFEVDPEPHTFFGSSLVERLINDQDISTSLWRGLIDNMHMSNTPGYAFDPAMVKTDDLMNNEIGKLVRTQGSPADKIMPLTVPFAAGATIPAMEYYDQLLQDKTGVSRVSMGLDPDSLQNTTATAVNASVGAAQGQMEAMARNLAEGGLCQLYKILLQLIRQHSSAEEIIMVDGQFVPVNPASWSSDMSVTVNVGLGRGGEQERMATLQQTLQMQQAIYQGYGPNNGLVTLTQIRNTLADIQRLGGVYNSGRYYQPMDAQKEFILTQQAAQAAQQQQGQADPAQISAQALVQAEVGKAQIKAQTDMVKINADAQAKAAEEQRKRFEMGMTDDLERDKMVQELAIEVAKIMGQYGTTVDVAAINAAQNAPREVGQ